MRGISRYNLIWGQIFGNKELQVIKFIYWKHYSPQVKTKGRDDDN